MSFIFELGEDVTKNDRWIAFKNKIENCSFSTFEETTKLLEETANYLYSYILEIFENDSEYFQKSDYFGINGTFKYIFQLSLEYPVLFPERIEKLNAMEDRQIKLNKKQIGCILTHLFFNHFKSGKYYGRFMFHSYFTGEKLKLFLNYFNMIKHKTEDEMKNTITYIRKGLRAYFDFSTINSGMYPVIPRTGSLENEKGRIAIFANANPGGGVLGDGFVQEEMLEWIYTESLVIVFLGKKLRANEALEVQGIEKFNDMGGYSRTAHFEKPARDGLYKDQTFILFDSLAFNKSKVVYIENEPFNEFSEVCIKREIKKSIVAMMNEQKLSFKTGNWGCGAFNSDYQLKFVIQWIAASVCRVTMEYFFYNREEISTLITELNKTDYSKIPISTIYKYVIQYCHIQNEELDYGVLEYIINLLQDNRLE